MGSSIDSLPNEVVDLILNEATGSLSSLCLVDKRFQNLTMPHLLREVSFNSTYAGLSRQHKLLDLLINNRSYCSYIHTVSLDWTREESERPPAGSPYNKVDKAKIMAIAEEFNLPQGLLTDHDWEKSTLGLDLILLNLLDNLRRLEIKRSTDLVRPIVDYLGKLVKEFQGSIEKLHGLLPCGLLTVESLEMTDSLPEDSTFALFLPKIQEIEVYGLGDPDTVVDGSRYPKELSFLGVSTVEELTYKQVEYAVPVIAPMLKLTKHLTSFSFCPWEDVQGDFIIELIEALYEVAGSTLIFLDIDILKRDDEEYDNLLQKIKLIRFQALQEVKLSLPELLGDAGDFNNEWDDIEDNSDDDAEDDENEEDKEDEDNEGEEDENDEDEEDEDEKDEDESVAPVTSTDIPSYFPPSLKTLHFYQDDDADTTFLSLILTSKTGGHLPNLTSFVFECSSPVEVEFIDTCRQAGVDFHFKQA